MEDPPELEPEEPDIAFVFRDRLPALVGKRASATVRDGAQFVPRIDLAKDVGIDEGADVALGDDDRIEEVDEVAEPALSTDERVGTDRRRRPDVNDRREFANAAVDGRDHAGPVARSLKQGVEERRWNERHVASDDRSVLGRSRPKRGSKSCDRTTVGDRVRGEPHRDTVERGFEGGALAGTATDDDFVGGGTDFFDGVSDERLAVKRRRRLVPTAEPGRPTACEDDARASRVGFHGRVTTGRGTNEGATAGLRGSEMDMVRSGNRWFL